MIRPNWNSIVMIVIFATAGLARAADANAYEVQFDPAQTKVEFTLGDVLHTVHGSFKLSRGSVQFDASSGAASGALTIEANSGDSGSEPRDSRMKKNILETGRYPEIVFLPDHVKGSVREEGASHLEVHGTFRIHGAGHELVLPVEVQRSGDRLTLKTEFEVPYVEWGMKNPSTLFLRVDKRVRIDIQAATVISSAH
jgi:polyisoprenoid-binding protein YceI